jgi:hypothetical protein
MVQPRRYTPEKIRFVMERIGLMKNATILAEYNDHFHQGDDESRHLTAKQLKYLRLTYGTDPAFG